MPSTHHRMRRGLLLCAVLMLSVGVACTSTTQPSSVTTVPLAAATATAVTGAAPTSASAAITRSPTALVTPSPAAVASIAPSVATSAPSSDNLLTAVRIVSRQVKPVVVQITNQQQVQASQFNQPFVVPQALAQVSSTTTRATF